MTPYIHSKIGYRGSLARGQKHTGEAFDINKWDCDAFIVDDYLASQITAKNNFRDLKDFNFEVKNMVETIGGQMSEISGYAKVFTFRVWSTAEFNEIVKKEAYKLF